MKLTKKKFNQKFNDPIKQIDELVKQAEKFTCSENTNNLIINKLKI